LSNQIVMRAPCKACSDTDGVVAEVNGQDTVRCATCNRFQYNAPRTETGRAERTVTTVHNGIKPKQRAKIIMRAGAKCEYCGARGDLHVGHILSVEAGLNYGIGDDLLNHDENLLALCPECNLGMGHEPMSLRLAVAILRARISWAKKHEGQ
jgi:5-methylcytosine-specific restriction endonuclease McrA